MSLSHEQLILLGRKAAHGVIGSVADIEVASGTNEEGLPSYCFERQIFKAAIDEPLRGLRTRLRQKIRDLLIAENDSRYPYVRIR